VASLADYDLKLFEDETTNRMHEALTLFKEIVRSRWFRNVPVVLYLNKRDLFAEKLPRVPLTVCFPEYTGPQRYDEAVEFISNRFGELSHSDKPVYTHCTCATDQHNQQHVFNAVKDILIRRSLCEAGLSDGGGYSPPPAPAPAPAPRYEDKFYAKSGLLVKQDRVERMGRGESRQGFC
jgi:hypothetical protein